MCSVCWSIRTGLYHFSPSLSRCGSLCISPSLFLVLFLSVFEPQSTVWVFMRYEILGCYSCKCRAGLSDNLMFEFIIHPVHTSKRFNVGWLGAAWDAAFICGGCFDASTLCDIPMCSCGPLMWPRIIFMSWRIKICSVNKAHSPDIARNRTKDETHHSRLSVEEKQNI